MDSRVELVEKNRRFRIVHLDQEVYLLDMEQRKWLVFFPFLFWLLPHKVYQLTVEQAERIREPIVEERKNRSYFWFIMGSSIVVEPLLEPLFEKVVSSTIIFNLLILVVYTISILFLRLSYLKNKRLQVVQKIKYQELETNRIKVKPKYFKQFIKPIWITLLFTFLLYLAGYVFITLGILAFLLLYLCFLPVLLMSLFIFYNPDMGKDNQYRVTLVE